MPSTPDPIRRVLFGNISATPATPRPSTMSSPSFDPQTPGSPESLTAVGLSATPASDATAFYAILSGIISNSLGFDTAQQTTLDTQLGTYLAAHHANNEASFTMIRTDLWKDPSAVSPNLSALTPPVLSALSNLTTPTEQALGMNRFLSAKATYRVLTRWSGAMVNPQNLRGSSHVRSTGTSAALSPAEDKTQRFTISNFTADVSEGEDYIRSVRNAFGGAGKLDFLDDETVCDNDKSQSQSYASRIRGSISGNKVLNYIVSVHETENNCARLWKIILTKIQSKGNSLTRECHLWNGLFDTRCDDIDQFPVWYSSVISKLHDLKTLKSQAEKDTNFKRVLFHKSLDVDELKDVCKLFLTDFNSTAEQLLEKVHADYDAIAASETIKDNTSGSKSTTKSILRRTEQKGSTSDKGGKLVKKVSYPTGSAPKFPGNYANRIPSDVYTQVRDWFKYAAKEDKSEEDEKWLKNFNFRDRRTKEEAARVKRAAKQEKTGGYRDQIQARHAATGAGYTRGYDGNYHRGGGGYRQGYNSGNDGDYYPPNNGGGDRGGGNSDRNDDRHGGDNRGGGGSSKYARQRRAHSSMMNSGGNDGRNRY